MSDLDLTIVTSCHGYGQYLGQWAESLLRQDVPPTAVAILTHGSEEDRRHGEAAASVLGGAMFHVKHRHVDERLDFGAARNAAVALSATAWVQHLDCDDMAMPHMVAEIARLAPSADVVSLGYERCGDLQSGPKFLRKTYRRHQGQGTLTDTTPSSGVSPFRRSFWERSPYRTDLIGGWDTALWIGFAHLNARFVPTPQPCFWYRQHADSVFNVRRKSGWEAAWTGRKLQSLRRQDHGVAIVVPLKPDGGSRDRNWDWLRRRFERTYPDWEILEGLQQGGRWNKGRAVQVALASCTAETLVIADADCVHPDEALGDAVRLVQSGTPWVVPHDKVHRLGRDATEQWLGCAPGWQPPVAVGLQRSAYQGYAGGGSVVVPRVTYEAVGGIPLHFEGWGGEDEALGLLLDTLAGPHVRLSHPLVHLWHEAMPSKRSAEYRRNRAILGQYMTANGNPGRMFALVQNGASSRILPYSDADWRHSTHGARAEAMRNDLREGRGDFFVRKQLTQRREAREAERALAAEERKRLVAGMEAAKQAKLAARGKLAPPHHDKMLAGPPANKQATPAPVIAPEPIAEPNEPEEGGTALTTLSVAFASSQAEQAAQDAGLTDDRFADLEPDGARGFTLAQVRELAG